MTLDATRPRLSTFSYSLATLCVRPRVVGTRQPGVRGRAQASATRQPTARLRQVRTR
ncbi:hypothetical protein FMEAI12_3890040 [Parafrankia sp. Ea1.12]|nr:hypothetical protein FMEAI12_3890040 [Parafrankia sp. Ea1.12]